MHVPSSRQPRPATLSCVAALVLLFGSFACARDTSVRQRLVYPQAVDAVKRILVVPFENLTPFPEGGIIVSDLVADELRGWMGFEVIGRHQVETQTRRGDISLPLHWSRAEALQFARLLRADAVLYGNLLEYGYLREHRGVTERGTFGVTLRLVSAESGKLIWSGSLTGSGGSDFRVSRPPLTDVSRKTLRQAFARMFEAYDAYRLERQRQRETEGEAS